MLSSDEQALRDSSALALTRAEFAEAAKELFDHLYDSPYLQKHRLALAFVGREIDPRLRSQELRRTLLDAIQAMRPAPRTPAQSPDWRAYRILELRYLEGLTPRQTMEQIALAKSQFYREQARILDALIEHLWTQHQSHFQTGPASTAPERLTKGHPADEERVPRAELVQSEVERLCAHAEWQNVDIGEVLAELQPVVEKVAVAQSVSFQMTPATALCVSRADRVLLRQAILNVITYGLDLACGGGLVIAPLRQQNATGLRILAHPSHSTGSKSGPAPKQRQGIGLQISQQLMRAMGGELVLVPSSDATFGQPTKSAGNDVLAPVQESVSGASWEACLIWPTDTAPIVLVIDDNEHFLQLFRRYLVGYEWQVIGVTDGAQTWRILEEIRPTVIILDVMMPKEDGWAILQRLQATPATYTLPVIICSVLNEPHLAQSLGAAAYLPKPVSQRALLQMLARWQPGAASLPPAHPASP